MQISNGVRKLTQNLSKKVAAATAAKTVEISSIVGAGAEFESPWELAALRRELAIQEARHMEEIEAIKRMIPPVQPTPVIRQQTSSPAHPEQHTKTWVATPVGQPTIESSTMQWLVSSPESPTHPTTVAVTTMRTPPPGHGIRPVGQSSYQTEREQSPRQVGPTVSAVDPLREAIGTIGEIDGYLAEIRVRQSMPAAPQPVTPDYGGSSSRYGGGYHQAHQAFTTTRQDTPPPMEIVFRAPPNANVRFVEQSSPTEPAWQQRPPSSTLQTPTQQGRVVGSGRYVLQLLPDV